MRGLCAAILAAPFLLAVPVASAPLCEGGNVAVFVDFAQAGLAACNIAADGAITGEVEPEIRPINPSPWYALRVEAPEDAEPVVTLRYGQGRHRYHPWVRAGDGAWQRLPTERVRVAEDGSATIRLPAMAGSRLVAGQPLDDVAAAVAPFEDDARDRQLHRIDGVLSLAGQPIRMFLHRPEQPRGLALFLTRQHPPEWPGAVAFDAFARAVMADTPLMRRLRSEIAILWVPVMNPDGIARGHWRGNKAGADLNRDWGPFRQPETQGVGEQVEQLAGTLPLLAVMDFHATRRDVLYAPPIDPARRDAGQRFADQMALEPEMAMIPVSRSHTVNAGTLKGWALDRFGVSGLTYEVGDDTDPALNRVRANIAARMMAESILATLDEGTAQ